MKFSILNLLLVAATVAAVVALFISRQEKLEAAKRYEGLIAEQSIDLEKLRQETGYLTISDPEKISAVKVRSSLPNSWSYRVYLPEGRNYYFACKINSLPLSPNLPTVGKRPALSTIATLGRNSIGIGNPSGEYVVTLSVGQAEGEWKYRLNVRPSGDAGEGSTGGARINDHDGKWPTTNDHHGVGIGGVTHQRSFSVGRSPCVLLDLRAMSETVTSSANPDQGAMLWVGVAD